MSRFSRFIDAHSHLCDPRSEPFVDQWLQEAESLGIHYFMQGGVDPADWDRQKALKARYPEKIGLCFGLHPYFVASNEEEQCEVALDRLARELPAALAIGEMGLDFRPHIMKESKELQKDVFRDQLELAQFSNKPMVLHLVQAFEDSLRIMDLVGLPQAKGLVHSFNGSLFQAEAYIERGLYLSVGGPAARKDNARLHQAILKMPLEHLLLETDSPDQPPDQFKGQLNPLASLIQVAQAVAHIRQMETLEILEISSHNFRRLFLLPES